MKLDDLLVWPISVLRLRDHQKSRELINLLHHLHRSGLTLELRRNLENEIEIETRDTLVKIHTLARQSIDDLTNILPQLLHPYRHLLSQWHSQ